VRRVVVTGLGCACAAGVGTASLRDALASDRALGEVLEIETFRGRKRPVRLARLAPFDRETFLPSRKLRRMGELSRLWVVCCMMARSDAGWSEADGVLPPPERRGTFLGTGFGCINTTWEYLTGMLRDGAATASPFLFAESVANAPAGHSAIELDTRGADITITCGDASAATALEMAARAIRDGRLEMAYCGGVEMMSESLVRVLASLRSPLFLGEGGACLVLESLDLAQARKARIYAEVAGAAMASDPAAPATDYSRDSRAMERVIRRALASAGGDGRPFQGPLRKVFLHAAGSPQAVAAERDAVERVCPGVPA
jgi:3-oxoacyl-(acyl-carrier-protein) synthase